MVRVDEVFSASDSQGPRSTQVCCSSCGRLHTEEDIINCPAGETGSKATFHVEKANGVQFGHFRELKQP